MAQPLAALAVQTPNVAGAVQAAESIRANRLQQLLAQKQIDKADRDEKSDNALREFYKTEGPALSRGDENALAKLAEISPEKAAAYRKSSSEDIKTQLEIATKRAELIGRSSQAILNAPPALRPMMYSRTIAQLKQMGVPVNGAPEQYDEAYVKSAVQGAMSLADQLNKYRTMTSEEVQSAGMAPGTVAQVSGKGQINVVSKPPDWKDPEYIQAQKDIRAAGKTDVNVGTGEKEYDKKRGGFMAENANEIDTNAQKAVQKLGTINTLDAALADPSVYQGAAGEMVTGLKRVAKTLFGQDVQGVGTAELAQTIANEMATEMKSKLPGPMSDGDRQFLQSLPPSLSKTREGNLLIADFYRRMAQRDIQIQKLANAYERRNGRLDSGWQEKLAEWSDANPLFKPEDFQKVKDVASAAPQQGPAAGTTLDPESRYLIQKYLGGQ